MQIAVDKENDKDLLTILSTYFLLHENLIIASVTTVLPVFPRQLQLASKKYETVETRGLTTKEQ